MNRTFRGAVATFGMFGTGLAARAFLALGGLAMLGSVAAAEQRSKLRPCDVRPPVGDPAAELATARRLGAALTRPNDPIGIRGNVTDVVEVWNQTFCKVRVSKADPKLGQADREAYEIGPRGNLAADRSMWVPWIDLAYDPDKLPMIVWIDERPRFVIWQRDGRIYLLTHRQWASRERARWFGAAPYIPGVELEGGRRALHIHVGPDGQPFVRFAGVRAPR